jgi:hypothetical protein
MQHQHARKRERALTAVELSWVHTIIAYAEDAPAAPAAPAAPSKAERALRRKLSNINSARNFRVKQTQRFAFLNARKEQLECELPALLLQLQLATEENRRLRGE